LTVSGNGNVSLGGGALRNKDDSSGISGGSLSGASQMVGSSGAGTFTHTGGTNTLSTNLYVGYDSPGTYNLNGTGQLSSSNQYVGYSSTGTFNQLAGANTSYALYIGNGYASGTYNMDGGSLNVTAEHIGVQGEGTFNQTGGTHTLPQTAGVGNWGLSLGDKTGSSGTYNLSGTGELSSFQEVIGTQGTGIFTQSGGTNTISDRLVLAWSSGHGTYNLQGGQLNADKEYLGYYGGSTGVFTQTGGTNTVANTLYYGNSEGTGTYELNGGTLRLHTITVQNNAAFFRFGGGTLQATGDVSIRYDSGTPGQVVLPMTLTGVGGNANVDTAGYTITLADQLSGPGGLNKLGDNTLTLSASNTYGGGTIVKAGTLRVNNTTGSATGTGRVMVEANATLSGSGSIAGPLTIAGALAPGNSPGILTVNNQVTFRPGATFSVEINGLEAGSGYDQLATTGPVSLDGSLAVSFGSFTPTGDDVLFVVNNMGSAATTGMFQYADDSKIGMFNGYDWYITYDANNAAVPTLNGGNDVAIYSVPEPSSIALAGIGAASLFLYILRRRQ
jgi:autotransporter-associated beta strand protein